VLDAFEICVARHGVEGATLERVAEEAGLARALIRHNVGNRDDLLTAMVERFLDRARQETNEMIAALPERRRLETLVDWLFDPRYSDTHTVRVSDALVTAAAGDPVLAKRMRDWTLDFTRALERVLAEARPKAPKADCAAVAAGITGLYFSVESLAPLGGIKPFRKASKDATMLLLNALGTRGV
jgi:AcrR family transcriptional regulator